LGGVSDERKLPLQAADVRLVQYIWMTFRKEYPVLILQMPFDSVKYHLELNPDLKMNRVFAVDVIPWVNLDLKNHRHIPRIKTIIIW